MSLQEYIADQGVVALAADNQAAGSPPLLAASVEATSPDASACAAESDASPASGSAPDHDERAVRLALAAGTANLRLARVREVLDSCTPEDRRRILAAIEGCGI